MTYGTVGSTPCKSYGCWILAEVGERPFLTEFLQHEGSGLELLVISTPGVYRFVPKDDCSGDATLSAVM